jgi:16S rRNA (cytidine1402-2'-O)-methyltransferase
MLSNGLYIIATPIGNLQDISARAIEVLREAEVVACEDTRVSKKLFSLLGISLNKRFITYEDHNEADMAQKIIDIINVGQAVALISDAGSPLISDPGYKLVRQCREQGVYVTALPGACAVITALQLSGLPTNRFMFAGFIPNKDKARQELFTELAPVNTTLVFYETSPRLLKTLAQAEQIFAGREVAVVRELTKMYEEAVCGSFAEVIEHFSANEPKGEFVLVIAPPAERGNLTLQDIRPQLLARLQETSLKTAVKEICEQYNLNKNDVYAFALELKNKLSAR